VKAKELNEQFSKLAALDEEYKQAKSLEVKILGELIRHAREEKGLSVRAAAERSSVSAPFLSDVELGRRTPSKITFDSIVETVAG